VTEAEAGAEEEADVVGSTIVVDSTVGAVDAAASTILLVEEAEVEADVVASQELEPEVYGDQRTTIISLPITNPTFRLHVTVFALQELRTIPRNTELPVFQWTLDSITCKTTLLVTAPRNLITQRILLQLHDDRTVPSTCHSYPRGRATIVQAMSTIKAAVKPIA
jgi:hypothetical protein